MKIILFLGALLVVSCGSKQKTRTHSDVIPVDLSGTMERFGGLLLDESHVAHVTHWTSDPRAFKGPKIVKFKGLDGTISSREIIDDIDLGNDLNILTLDTPLDLLNHVILPVAEPLPNQPVTLYRLNREPFGTYLDNAFKGIVYAWSDGRVRMGDSGKIWVQLIDGIPHVVSLTSTEKSKGPHLAPLIKEWRKSQIETTK
jgi:hypothetical protein